MTGDDAIQRKHDRLTTEANESLLVYLPGTFARLILP